MDDHEPRDSTIARSVRILFAMAAIVAQLALGWFYFALSVLLIPTPANYLLMTAWALELGVTILVARRRAFLAPLVPLLSFVVGQIILSWAERHFDWVA